jgi:hypothetical protein
MAEGEVVLLPQGGEPDDGHAARSITNNAHESADKRIVITAYTIAPIAPPIWTTSGQVDQQICSSLPAIVLSQQHSR